ncbi:MAG: hypothetical protein MJB14_12465 [Spirochaetes bacterium]|nr:hypothetical protein [Spirochaetota bacterium]
MNEDVTLRVKEDFYVLKKLIASNEHIAKLLKIDFVVAKEIVNDLIACSENGPIEAKKNLLSKILDILDDALYKAIPPGKIIEVLKLANELVFLTMINFKVLSGKKKPHRQQPKQIEIDYEKIDIKEIMHKIPELSQKYNEASRYIRLITALLKKYKEVSQEMDEKLLITRELSKSAIQNTYLEELNNIIKSIKKHYYNIIQNVPELRKQYLDLEVIDHEEAYVDDFKTYDFSYLKHFLLKQLSEFSRIRSCLVYIKEEGYHTLPIITELYKQRRSFYRLLDEEETSVFNFMSDNSVGPEEYNNIISRIRYEISNYIQDFYIQPYTRDF